MKKLFPVLWAFVAAAVASAQAPQSMPPAGATVAASAPSTRPGPKPGEFAPDFTVVGPDGKEIKLSDFRGKLVLVDIWATWCGPCIASMPHNSEFAEKYAANDLVVLAVCADDSRAAYDGWVKRNGAKYKFLTAHDPAGKDGWDKSVFNTQYGVTGFPTMFLIGKDGRLVGTTGGGGPTVNPSLVRLLAKGGLPVDLSGLPPEEANRPKSIPMIAKTAAMPTAANPTLKFANMAAGETVPDFSTTDASGKTVKLSDFRGKPVFINFWTGARNPPDDVAKIAAAYQAQGLAVWAINTATERADFEKWAKESAAPGFTVSWDPAGKAIMEAISHMIFGAGMYPAYCVVGPDGKLVGGIIGMGPRVSGWLREILQRADVKLSDADKALIDQALAAARAAGPAPAMGGGMLPATPTPAAAKAPFRESYGKLKAGDVVPDFTVLTPDGKEAKFSDFAKGKTVVLDFWATWCGPCQKAMPHYEEIHRKYAGKGVVILGVCGFDPRENYDKWLADNQSKYTFATVFDPVGKPAAGDKAAMSKTVMMQVSGGALTPLPTTLVINPAGKLVGSYVGYGDSAHDALANLLMLAGVELANEDKPKTFFPAGSTVRAATITPQPGGGMAPAAPRAATLGTGDVAPDFTMQDVTGRTVKLSDFKDKVIILDFWATWCGPCIASFPHTQKIAAKYKDQGVVVVASGTSDTIAKFQEWIPKNQPKYPDLQFFFDANERGSATFEQRASSRLYRVVGIPTQFIIGRDGKIAATIVGNGGEDDARTEAALASVGIKVDAPIVAKGQEQLAKSAAEEKARAAAAVDAEKNPRPPFNENFGKLKAGEVAPEIDLLRLDGTTTPLSTVLKGHVTVVGVWSGGHGPGDPFLAAWKSWGEKYPNVTFIGVGGYAAVDAVQKWQAENAAKFTGTLFADPAGLPPQPAKPMDELTDDERAAFRKAGSEHMAKIFTFKLGGVMTPVPTTIVFDADGKLVGWSGGFGGRYPETLGNLLLRAGVKLAPADMPAKVWTAADIAAATPKPEPKVELLKIGAAAPDFVSQTIDGKDVKLSELRGKVVVLDFWATWCGPCIASMPHTQEVAAHYKDQGVVVLASCTSDTRAKFEQWVKANAEKYPDLIWTHDAAERKPERVSRALYGVGGIPCQFVIDRDGKIVDIVIGYMPGEAILEAALSKAGINVDPALVAKGAADLKRRG